MEIALVVLGVLAAGLVVAAGWLVLERGRLASAAVRAAAEGEAAQREALQIREEAARLNEQTMELRAELQRVTGAAAAAVERAEGFARQMAEGVRRGEKELADALAERDGLWEEKLRREREVSATKLESAQRERDAVVAQLAQMEAKMREAFAALSREAMEKNSAQFLTMAEQKLEAKRSAVDALVQPIAETLKRTDEKLAVIESAGTTLKEETGRLVRALRDPHVRGRYGEIQLRRVAELAGMSAYCDFAEQEQTRDAEGVPLRPDMVVKLPNERVVVVDAKTNIRAYLEAMEAATPEEAEACLERFARHVSEQAAALARKKYWTQYSGSPEFVVMFIPGDQFVDAALSRQADLLERAAEQGVIMASPATLIGLLRAVAVGYQEQRLARAAEELRDLGKELHERAATAFAHVLQLGRAINATVESYNKFVGSYESRLEPTLKKFEEAGVKSAKELPEVQPVDTRTRVME
ncbi:MAG: DNA recombination protein RmuC [Phycisphaeraceae bacterium]|nr:DNA recombination protein RmuC [Phycisphaeraceae bacterium]